MKRLLQLFSTLFVISAFTFGGGFVIVSLMKKKLVDGLRWLSEEEMLDITALAQSCPGPIAINAAILVGRRVAGLPGIACAVLGTLLPPLLIMSALSVMYAAFASNRFVAAALRGMQCGVAALLMDVTAGLGGKVVKTRSSADIALMVFAFLLAFLMKVSAPVLILAAAGLGIARAVLASWKGAKTC